MSQPRPKPSTLLSLQRISAVVLGVVALAWFLIRVIPKPSRASYPCQRAAFPIASGLVLWVVASVTGLFTLRRLQERFRRHRLAVAALSVLAITLTSGWMALSFRAGAAAPEVRQTKYDWKPEALNAPIGTARGIFPGRVVWTRDPAATKWAGHWKENADQWWLDANTDQARVDVMLSTTLRQLTGTGSDEAAWTAIFQHYNQTSRGLACRGPKPGEVVAIKINLNNSSTTKQDNQTDASPQMVLAMVRQLVRQAHVAPGDILVYDVRRGMPPYLLTKIWSEYKDVRFIQEKAPSADQPKNPGYGDYRGLEAADWVEGLTYSSGTYDKAKFIARQVKDATYLINFALLKAHSYPYNDMEDGDEGQTALTMTGKNHFGSIQGTWELHAAINTNQQGTPHAYSPMVDLAAAPNLGAKTILFLLDGLYCGRKWRSYPLHFPNAPFHNRVEPYENTDWPASLLASFDGVALDSVGLDILNSQTKHNGNPANQNRPRILIRENADDYLHEMADPQHAPSGTAYKVNGKPTPSLGVHEHWDGDTTRRYSRNLAPKKGKGIELFFIPL